MSSVVVIGGGPGGLAAAMFLAQEGIEVTVLERDPQDPPETCEEAWERWSRPGVAQFHQAHALLPRGRKILESRLPGIVEHLSRLGAHWLNLTDAPPPTVADKWTPQLDDDRFETLAARRPLYELAFARAAEKTPGVEVRRGVEVTGLTYGAQAIDGVPHVTGVIDRAGEEISADLVIDAGGRRSRMPDLLADLGAPELLSSSDDFRFIYYTRYYRKRQGEAFPQPYNLSRFPSGSISIATIPADNDIWSVTLYGTSADKALRTARNAEVFQRVILAHPARSGFIDAEPISDVIVMAGVADRERLPTHHGRPIATGWIPVADAWACTNPLLGRGITMGLMHAEALAPVISKTLGRPADLVREWDHTTSTQLRPWYETTQKFDQTRSEEMNAIRTGKVNRQGENLTRDEAAFLAAMMTDPEVFRAQLEIVALLGTSEEVMSRPEIHERIASTAADMPDLPTPEIPTRSELESLLA